MKNGVCESFNSRLRNENLHQADLVGKRTLEVKPKRDKRLQLKTSILL